MSVTVYTNPRTGDTVALDQTRPDLIADGWTVVADHSGPAAVAAIAALDARRDPDAHVAALVAAAETAREAANATPVDPQQISDAIAALSGQPSGLAALDAGGDVPAAQLDHAPVLDVAGKTGHVSLVPADVPGAETTAGAQAKADAAAAGKLQASQNLADVASAASARTSLGLGNAATRNVGTTPGTVAAGDDARFSAGGGASFASIFKFGTGA